MIGTRSYMAKGEEVERKWYLIDATDKHLGRLAVQVARILSGKHKPTYTPHVDTGDFVVVINADKVGLTGKKLIQSKIRRHTGHPGGLKTLSYKEVLERRPEQLIERVVWGPQAPAHLRWRHPRARGPEARADRLRRGVE